MNNGGRIVFACAGACVGAAAMLGIVSGARLIDRVVGAHGSAGTASSTCDNASFQVTVATGPGESSDLVTAQVAIYDAAGRDWQVLWRGYSWPPTTVGINDKSLPIGDAFEVLGDHDDGTDRSVWIRPAGETTWCKVTAGLE